MEERAPLLESAVRDAKETLKEVGPISEERYLELRRTPAPRLSLADAVRVAIYESGKVRAGCGRLRTGGAAFGHASGCGRIRTALLAHCMLQLYPTD